MSIAFIIGQTVVVSADSTAPAIEPDQYRDNISVKDANTGDSESAKYECG